MNDIDLFSQPSYSNTVKLYHVTDDYHSDRLLKFKLRDKPTDTPLMIHDMVNKLSMKRFNIPIRRLFFTYTRPLNSRAMRAIPLSDSVQYFYHPDIEDFTSWIYSDFKSEINNEIEDFIYQYDINTSMLEMTSLWENVIEKNDSIRLSYDTCINLYKIQIGDDNAEKITSLIFTTMLSMFKEYIENIRHTTDIDDIPYNTESEIMIYAPDNIYLISNDTQ